MANGLIGLKMKLLLLCDFQQAQKSAIQQQRFDHLLKYCAKAC